MLTAPPVPAPTSSCYSAARHRGLCVVAHQLAHDLRRRHILCTTCCFELRLPTRLNKHGEARSLSIHRHEAMLIKCVQVENYCALSNDVSAAWIVLSDCLAQ